MLEQIVKAAVIGVISFGISDCSKIDDETERYARQQYAADPAGADSAQPDSCGICCVEPCERVPPCLCYCSLEEEEGAWTGF